jgi:hypothetical protein
MEAVCWAIYWRHVAGCVAGLECAAADHALTLLLLMDVDVRSAAWLSPSSILCFVCLLAVAVWREGKKAPVFRSGLGAAAVSRGSRITL